MISPELEGWAALRGAFARLLRVQRTGRPVEEVALYMAELATPRGIALAQAIHGARLGPDPALFSDPERQRVSVGLLTAKEMVGVVTNAAPLFEGAVVELHCVPPPRHVHLVFAPERAGVVQMPLEVLLPLTEGGVS